MVNVASILAVLLFVFNGFICDLFTSDLVAWWTLRTNLYALIFGLALYLTTVKHNKFSEYVCYVGVGFATSDIIDRVFFNCNQFTKSDFIMILITIVASYYKVYVRQRR